MDLCLLMVSRRVAAFSSDWSLDKKLVFIMVVGKY